MQPFTNKKRGQICKKLIDIHGVLTESTINNDDEKLIDVLCNLRHMCNFLGLDFEAADQMAFEHYSSEITDEDLI